MSNIFHCWNVVAIKFVFTVWRCPAKNCSRAFSSGHRPQPKNTTTSDAVEDDDDDDAHWLVCAHLHTVGAENCRGQFFLYFIATHNGSDKATDQSGRQASGQGLSGIRFKLNAMFACYFQVNYDESCWCAAEFDFYFFCSLAFALVSCLAIDIYRFLIAFHALAWYFLSFLSFVHSLILFVVPSFIFKLNANLRMMDEKHIFYFTSVNKLRVWWTRRPTMNTCEARKSLATVDKWSDTYGRMSTPAHIGTAGCKSTLEIVQNVFFLSFSNREISSIHRYV